MSIAVALAPVIGIALACLALGVSRATYYRLHGDAQAPAPSVPRAPSALALSGPERQAILDVLHAPEHVDSSVRTVYVKLLDTGRYLGSVSTFYRVLRAAAEVRPRRAERTHPVYAKPELLAIGPRELWSWDITKLKGPAKWLHYHLYVILDVFSRYVVGWMLADRESAQLAHALISATCDKEGIGAGQLTLHADRGTSMRSKPVALLLADLGVTKTHSRPRVSDDNPFSEAQFRTVKYHPDFPARFDSELHARTFCQSFFPWYNHEHCHSGIGYMPPAAVHFGQASERYDARQQVLGQAFSAHPLRFKGRPPHPPALPTQVGINLPSTSSRDHGERGLSTLNSPTPMSQSR
jgi:putative transposase